MLNCGTLLSDRYLKVIFNFIAVNIQGLETHQLGTIKNMSELGTGGNSIPEANLEKDEATAAAF